jgi:hypothetical protein
VHVHIRLAQTDTTNNELWLTRQCSESAGTGQGVGASAEGGQPPLSVSGGHTQPRIFSSTRIGVLGLEEGVRAEQIVATGHITYRLLQLLKKLLLMSALSDGLPQAAVLRLLF